jgi:hypothetical protein
VVYHWWSEESDAPPVDNLRTPVLHSIASLRAVDKTIPIYILDGSKKPQNWHYWSSSLRFQVIPIKFAYEEEYADKPGYRNLSRIEDLWNANIPENKVIYSDADVFWIRSPRPLAFDGSKFAFNKFNSGFFYYDRTSPAVHRFHRLWHAYVTTALNDENFRILSRQYTDYREWYFVLDETVLTYMAYKMPELFDLVDTNEHCTAGMAVLDMPKPEQIKMFHTHGILVRDVFHRTDHARGLTPLLIKECWESMKNIGEDKLKLLYKQPYMDKYLPYQCSLFDTEVHGKLIATKTEKGLCCLTQALGIS